MIITVTGTADIYSPQPSATPTLYNGLAQLVDDLFTKIIFAKFRADLIWLIHCCSSVWECCSCSGWTVLITLYGEIKQGETGEWRGFTQLQTTELSKISTIISLKNWQFSRLARPCNKIIPLKTFKWEKLWKFKHCELWCGRAGSSTTNHLL